MQTTIIAVVTLILGALLGHVLTTTREHKKWLADQLKAEYRDLIDLLYDTVTVVTEERPGSGRPNNPERLNVAVQELARMFEDRIFIAEQLRKSDVKTDWLKMKEMNYYDPDLRGRRH
ncbi:hypothetical protein [Alloacidobacterium sp.]|uniref:hypothetical protein n=1 Tax=Alloacidobacterium sp. TaxID=2951999 RepID=UPI002D676B1E|nr:hypothetical protein [Alloacidobacterium sp.]HYK36339.1 hypothetical protein [Alloacidobacterium sp.]